MFKVFLTPQAIKDQVKIERAGLKPKAKKLLEILKENPQQYPPSFEKLTGNLSGFYSRRINIHHRLVYQILPNEHQLKDEYNVPYDGIVKVVRLWTHYSHLREYNNQINGKDYNNN